MSCVAHIARRFFAPCAVAGCALGLAACGGGIFLGYDGRNLDDRPPVASLAVSPGSATPGQTVRLVAAASDDFGVASVAFYRAHAGGATLLGVDDTAPYAFDAQLPTGSAASVEFFARVTDDIGQQTDSASVNVTVLP